MNATYGDEAESDILPFALDGDSSAPSPRDIAAAGPGNYPAARALSGSGGAAGAGTGDAAVGAFVRLLQEAPALRSGRMRGSTTAAHGPGIGSTDMVAGGPITLQAGLAQVARMRAKLGAGDKSPAASVGA